MKAHGIAKRERLTRRRDFEAVYAAKQSAADGRLVVCVCANDLGFSRMGRSVSGKWGKAHRRNRFRRLCSEAFRLHKHEIPAGFDIVIIPRKTIELDLDEVAGSLVTLCRKVCKSK